KVWSKQLCIVRVGRGEDMFQKQLWLVARSRQDHCTRAENVIWGELARAHDTVAAHDVGDEAADLLEIADEISRQLCIRAGKFIRAHRTVTSIDLFCIEEFTGRRCGEGEAPGGFYLVQLLQNSIT